MVSRLESNQDEGALDFNTLSYLLDARSTTCSTVAIEIKLVDDVYSKQGKPRGTDVRQEEEGRRGGQW